MKEHAVLLNGIGNCRQLGGYVIGDRKIKQDIFIRSGRLNGLSSDDADLLSRRYRLQYIADLRMSEEQQNVPDPVIKDCTQLSLPVLERTDMDDPDPEFTAVYSDPGSTLKDKFEIIYKKQYINRQMYPDFLFKARGKTAYREFFKAVLSLEDERAILWHCTDGKDRTGVAAMLLLSALGASGETVIYDYMLTMQFNADKLESVSQLDWARELDDEKRSLLMFISGGVIEEYMTYAVDVLEERYGSVTAYLSQELGVKSAEIKYLRERYLV